MIFRKIFYLQFPHNVLYEFPIVQLPHPPLSKIWGKIWHKDELPKINTFCWELIHRKMLIAENLQSRKVHGPSRCVLCKAAKESIHVFFRCPFSVEVWNYSIRPLNLLKSFLRAGQVCLKIGSSIIRVIARPIQ